MKKVLKVLGIVVLVIIVVVGILLIILSKREFVPKEYYKGVETGGDIEKKYLELGSYEVSSLEEASLKGLGKYILYYPKELETDNKKYPVVVFVNGSGVKASKMHYLLEHMASWGFIAVGTEEEYDWDANASVSVIYHLQRLNDSKTYNFNNEGEKDNIFYSKIDFDNVGITGHSQGGVGVINAITDTKYKDLYKCAVSLSPTNKELATNLEWNYDATKVNTPIMLISGAGGGDDWVVTGEQIEEIYNDIPNNKIKVRRKDTPHNEVLYKADGYVTAWFMYYLQGDEEAGKAFFGENAEILLNNLYQNQEVDLNN